jgi:hypothetical protein
MKLGILGENAPAADVASASKLAGLDGGERKGATK